MHPRDLDRLRGWEFDALLDRFHDQDTAAAAAARTAAFSVTEVEN